MERQDPMADRIAVMPGSTQFDLLLLRTVAAEFGFRVDVAGDLREIRGKRDLAAVLFHRDALGTQSSWSDALLRLKAEMPGVRLVPCHGFSDSVDRASLSDSGAFHSLWLPLKESELRQCLGFVWEAEKRAGDAASEDLALPRFAPGRSWTTLPHEVHISSAECSAA